MVARPYDWKTTSLPEKHTIISLNRQFSAQEMKQIYVGLTPEQMEDKWFIYWSGDSLYFHRSWTGYCVYIVKFIEEGGKSTMFEAYVNRDPDQYSATNDVRDAKMISFLIDILLLKRDSVFPDDELSPEISAVKLWSKIGRAALGRHPGNQDLTDE